MFVTNVAERNFYIENDQNYVLKHKKSNHNQFYGSETPDKSEEIKNFTLFTYKFDKIAHFFISQLSEYAENLESSVFISPSIF